MASQDVPSAACCDTPMVTPQDSKSPYEEKGKWETINGLKTYITGPESAKRAILYVYDIFGIKPQTIQGADLLASTASSLVVMPDLFRGHPFEEHPIETKKERIQEFRATTASRSANIVAIIDLVTQLKQADRFPHVAKWGILGFCWGGKIVSLIVSSSQNQVGNDGASSSTLFAAAAQSSPSSMDPEEAKSVSIPMAVLASQGEDANVVREYAANIPVQDNVVLEIFDNMVHGWMSARADLTQASVCREYVRGYKMVGEFFSKYL